MARQNRLDLFDLNDATERGQICFHTLGAPQAELALLLLEAGGSCVAALVLSLNTKKRRSSTKCYLS
jgi:hypothetical protein